MTNAFMKTSEVARACGISYGTLDKWIRAGKGPRFMLTPGGHKLFRPEDVQSWVNGLSETRRSA